MGLLLPLAEGTSCMLAAKAPPCTSVETPPPRAADSLIYFQRAMVQVLKRVESRLGATKIFGYHSCPPVRMLHKKGSSCRLAHLREQAMKMICLLQHLHHIDAAVRSTRKGKIAGQSTCATSSSPCSFTRVTVRARSLMKSRVKVSDSWEEDQV